MACAAVNAVTERGESLREKTFMWGIGGYDLGGTLGLSLHERSRSSGSLEGSGIFASLSGGGIGGGEFRAVQWPSFIYMHVVGATDVFACALSLSLQEV